MAVAILIIPLADTLRIFCIRLMNGRSPFAADRNHIHHQLLDVGLTHREAALALYLVNISFILIALVLRNISSLMLLTVLTFLGALFAVSPYLIKVLRSKSRVSMVD